MSERPWYEEKEFLDLRDKWYKKLEKTGFEDIEILDNITRQPGSLMHGVSPGDLRRGLFKPETEEYFRCARRHWWRIRARSVPLRDRGGKRGAKPTAQADRLRIWDLHADGVSNPKIAEETGFALAKVKRVVKQEQKWMKEEWDWELDRLVDSE